MPDPMKVVTEPVLPITVTVIGTGDGGAISPGTIATTPGHSQPNLVVTIVTPLAAILVRFANAYLTTLVGLIGATLASDVLPTQDFLQLVATCAKLSVAGAGLGLLKDLLTVFSGLERKYPLATGSV